MLPPDSITNNCEIDNCCLVCGAPTEGFIHFGAKTCKACAAFFRRAVKSTKRNPICKFIDGKCKPIDKKWKCKPCRLQRCFDIGMTKDNVQDDRDLLSSVDNFSTVQRRKKFDDLKVIPNSMESFLGRPHFLITFEPDKASPKKYIVNVDPLLEKVRETLSTSHKSLDKLKNMNNLQRLAYGLNDIRKAQKTEVKIIKNVDRELTFKFFESHMTTVAKWLSYCDEFQSLDVEVRMKIIKCIWLAWNRMERFSINAELRGMKMLEDQLFLNSHETAISLDSFSVECDWYTNYSKEQMKYLNDYVDEKISTDLFFPFIPTQPTEIELAFMLSKLSFKIAGKRLDSTISTLMDDMVEKISDEIHDYYVNDMNNPKYAHRLKKILDITNSYEKHAMERREKMHLARMFDVFTAKLSDCDMMDELS